MWTMTLLPAWFFMCVTRTVSRATYLWMKMTCRLLSLISFRNARFEATRIYHHYVLCLHSYYALCGRYCPVLLLSLFMLSQGWIQPVRSGDAISVMFGSQVSLRVQYWKRSEVCLTTLLRQNNEGKMALYREWCFLNCTRPWWIKFLS